MEVSDPLRPFIYLVLKCMPEIDRDKESYRIKQKREGLPDRAGWFGF